MALSATLTGNGQQERAAKKKQRKSRSRGLRTTTGCRVCRQRHMKCDEEKPSCGACRRSGKDCEYKLPNNEILKPTKTPKLAASPKPEAIEIGNGETQSNATGQAESTEATETIQEPIPNAESTDLVLRQPSPEPQWPRTNALDGFTVTSPQSTLSSVGFGLDVAIAPLRWFDLLAGDASANDEDFSIDLLSWRDATSHGARTQPIPQSPVFESHPDAATFLPPTPSTTDILPPRKEAWQVAYQLQDHETPIFRRFVERISLWMDLFDPMKHFSSFVPHLAMANEGLMQAILALGARHMSIKPSEDSDVNREIAVEYYYKTLHYLQGAMKFESYNRSSFLIATALIVSMYEMIDGYGKGWERHLKGVFWIQRSRNIGAESFGLEGAGWWAWLRQDVWAAFRERRRVYSFHRPIKSYPEMDQYDLASRAVYLLAQAVNYSSEQDSRDAVNQLHVRIDRARTLSRWLEEWHRNLTIHFAQLPYPKSNRSSELFQPIWINPAPLATAVQMYHFAKILLLVHEPSAGGYNDFLRREKQLGDSFDAICGIAMTITDEAASISSTQCLFAAGLFTHDRDPRKREVIVRLIDQHQIRTGWPVNSLTEELQAEWNAADAK